MIECRNLTKSFNREAVLKGLNLTIPAGQATVVIGRSGEGKTVFLKHLIGLLRPDEGSVLVEGRDICQAKGEVLREIKEQFGIVFQSNALFDSLTIFENVAFPLRNKTSMPEAEIRERVESALASVDLAASQGLYPAEISGGMAKRVALARALAMLPRIILFDEPITGLDPVMRNNIIDLIAVSQERFRFTTVVVSHNIPEIFRVADQVAMLHDGGIIFAGSPEEIIRSDDERVQYFLSGGKEQR